MSPLTTSMTPAVLQNSPPVKLPDPKVVNSRIDGVLEALAALTVDDLDARIRALDAQRSALTSIRNALAAKERVITGMSGPQDEAPNSSKPAPALVQTAYAKEKQR